MVEKFDIKYYIVVFVGVIFFIISVCWSVFYPDLCPDEYDEKNVMSTAVNSIVKYKVSDCTRGQFSIYVEEDGIEKQIEIEKTHLCLYRAVEKGDSIRKLSGEKEFYLKKNYKKNTGFVRYDYKCESTCYCNFYLFNLE